MLSYDYRLNISKVQDGLHESVRFLEQAYLDCPKDLGYTLIDIWEALQRTKKALKIVEEIV